MSKNNNKTPNKEQKKENKTPKTPGKAPKPATEKNVEQVPEEIEEVVTIPMAADPNKLANRKRSGLSHDGQVRLLDLARRTFVEETDPELQFPQIVRKKINDIVAVGILCEFAEQANEGNTTFAAILATQAYPSLIAAAKEIGFTLPDIKALPAGTTEGTVMLAADNVKPSKEVKKQLDHEKQVREGAAPELDPEKITSEEDLKKALEYMFVTKNRRIVEILTEGVDFMKKFRLHEASLAENADEAKAKFEAYDTGNWLDDMFAYVRPSVFFTGIGRGMAHVIDAEKDPIHAFLIFRDAIRSKETNEPILNDEEAAQCVKSVVKWVCENNIASNEKAITNLDAKKNAKEIALCKKQIENYNSILDYLTMPTDDNVKDLLENIGSKFDEGGTLTPECQAANRTFNCICKSYYGKQLSTADYKNVAENVQQYAYHIINLFRAPGERIPDVGLSNVSDLEERTPEEKEALAKEAKKAWAEKKAEQKKADEKNA